MLAEHSRVLGMSNIELVAVAVSHISYGSAEVGEDASVPAVNVRVERQAL